MEIRFTLRVAELFFNVHKLALMMMFHDDSFMFSRLCLTF